MFNSDHAAYGVQDGKLIHISDVPRGLACKCVCAHCGRPLIAKKGRQRLHHFSHIDLTNCRGAPESILHLLCKEIFCELISIEIPPYNFKKEKTTKFGRTVQHQAVVAKGGTVFIEKIEIEKPEHGFVPDIVIGSKSKQLIIEIAVSHKVDRPKLRKIRKHGIPAIEIALNPSDSYLTRNDLELKLKTDLPSKKWLFHPAQREEEKYFLSKWREEISRLRNRKLINRQSVIVTRPSFSRSQQPSSLQPSRSACDRMAEEFHGRFGRYPTMEECLKLWPHLWGR